MRRNCLGDDLMARSVRVAIGVFEIWLYRCVFKRFQEIYEINAMLAHVEYQFLFELFLIHHLLTERLVVLRIRDVWPKYIVLRGQQHHMEAHAIVAASLCYKLEQSLGDF